MSGDNKLIDLGSNIIGGISSTAVSAIPIPGTSVLGAVVGPVVTAVTDDVFQRMLSSSEKSKVKGVSRDVIDKIQRRLENGDQPRCDDFYEKDEYAQSSASKLLEETLLKCKQEFEAKKLSYYGNFWANICFENGINYETANSLIGQFSNLSYQQIKILVFLNTGKTIQLGKWEKYMFTNETLAPYYTAYSDCLHLYNVRLAAQPMLQQKGIRIGTPDICISPSGSLMCDLLELHLSDYEMDRIAAMIGNIDAIVDRLMAEADDDGSDQVIEPTTKEEIEQIFEERKDALIGPIESVLKEI